jgi:hypothetical protein
MIKVFSPIMNQWLPLSATLDADTAKNWISSQAMSLLQLTAQLREPIQYLTIDGDTMESKRSVVEVLWCGYGSQHVRRTELHVVEAASFDVLLGSDFIFSEAILDLSKSGLLLEPQSH